MQALPFQVDGEDVVLWVAHNITKRRQLELQLKRLSETDALTGLWNWRAFEAIARDALAANKWGTQSPGAVDGRYRSFQADQRRSRSSRGRRGLLARVAAIMSAELRPCDWWLAGRRGISAILLPDARLAGVAAVIGERSWHNSEAKTEFHTVRASHWCIVCGLALILIASIGATIVRTIQLIRG